MPAKYDGRRLKSYIDSLPERGNRIVEHTGQVAETSAQERAPVRTGEMRDKTHFEMEGQGKGTLYADADHSGFVEHGTVHQSAQPWFTPGMMDAADAMPGIAREELKP